MLEVDYQPSSTSVQVYIYTSSRSVHHFIRLLYGVKMIALVQLKGSIQSCVRVIGMIGLLVSIGWRWGEREPRRRGIVAKDQGSLETS